MKIEELDRWISDFLNIQTYSADLSLNGLQVGREGKDVRKIALAVDACQEVFLRSAEQKADMILVHHGLFWGKPLEVTGRHYDRIKTLLYQDLCLYAVHIPLDAHETVGNNAGLADLLKLNNRQPFASWKGMATGVRGDLAEPLNRNDLVKTLFGEWEDSVKMLPFGKKEIQTVGIVSGGGAADVYEAIDAGLDLFVTGEPSHQIYHYAMEAGINVLFGGHYLTETLGVRLLGQKITEDLGLETFFIDLPTGL